jgi:hypothetical protein
VYERESALIANTQLLIEHLEAECVRVNGHFFLFLVSALRVVDFKDDDLHLDSNTQVDIATKFTVCEERSTYQKRERERREKEREIRW